MRRAALKSRAYTFECYGCRRQTSSTAGTAMHRTRLPLTAWFWAAHLMATHSDGMSARQLEDQLGLTYRTAWLLAQKLRRSMVDPDRELLEGVATPRRAPRRRKTATGMRQEGIGGAENGGQNQAATVPTTLNVGEPGTTQ